MLYSSMDSSTDEELNVLLKSGGWLEVVMGSMNWKHVFLSWQDPPFSLFPGCHALGTFSPTMSFHHPTFALDLADHRLKP